MEHFSPKIHGWPKGKTVENDLRKHVTSFPVCVSVKSRSNIYSVKGV